MERMSKAQLLDEGSETSRGYGAAGGAAAEGS